MDLMSDSDDRIDWTRVYGALADDSRRELIDYLAHTPGTVGILDAAGHLADGTEGMLARIEGQLYHVHLPKLAAAGLIRWERDRDVIALTSLGFRLPVGVLAPRSPSHDGPTVPERVGD